MTESVRRRSSKWDLKEDPDQFPTENRQGSGWSGRGGEFTHEKESRSEWKVSKGLNSHDPKWSSMEPRSVTRNEGNSRWSSSLEPTARNRGIDIYEFDKRDYNDMSRSMALEGDRSYSLSMSPGLDGWREKNRSRSPKGGWSRSHRSRSRSRSRSPPHGYRRDLEGSNGGRRSGSRVCGEFAEERSIRGNSHRFLHQDIQDTYEHNGRRHPGRSPGRGGSKHEKGGIRNAYTEEQMDRPRDKISRGYEDVYHRDLEKSEILRRNNISSDRPCIDFLEGNCRKGSSCRYPHHGAPSEGRGIRVRDLDRKETTVFYGHDNKRESQRLCKFYAAGYCRNGDSCRFSHEGAARGSPEGRSRDDRRGHDLDHENRLQGGSKWSDKQPAVLAYDGPDARSVTEKLVHHHLSDENRSWGGPKWSDITDSHSAGNEKRSSRGSKWSDRDAASEEKSNVWGNDNVGVGEKIGVVDPRSTERSFNSQQSHLDNASRTWGGPSRNDKPINFTLHKSPQWISDNSGGSMGFEEPKASGKFLASESMISTRDIEQYSLSINDSRGHNQDSQSHITNEMSIKIGKPDATQEVSAQPLSSFNMNIQNQTVLPTQPFNLNGGTQQQSSNLYSRTLPQHVEPIKKSDIVDPRLMSQQVSSGTSMTQNISTNETVAQLTNLSASLAQIFGNGQHLPQLYAALNPSTSGLVSSHSIEPTQVTAPQLLIQLNQTTHSEKQYDPINDSIDQTTDLAGGGSQSPMKSILPSSTLADPSGGDPPKISSLEENVSAINELKQPEKVMDKKEETVQMDADGDNQGDEEGKKSKDPKGMRMFKFALVQFVKEILKPTWKEGQMSKDAHKTIVKKVVDKVTSTIQAAQIPQTQEKTDQYLSYSKPKLTKLVQAYVEKHSKT